MGQTYAKNALNNTINQTITSSASVAIENNHVSSGINFFTLTNCNIDRTLISDQTNGFKVDMETVQKATVNQETQQKLEQNLKQLASTIAQNFDLNPGSKSSENLMNLSTKLSTEIISSVKATCSAKSDMINAVVCKDTTVGETGLVIITQKNYVDVMSKCAQDATIKSKAYQDFVQQVSQIAKTKVENAIFMILMMIAVIIGIIVFGGIGGIGKLLQNVLIIATVLLGLVFLDCYLMKLLCSKAYKTQVIAIAVTIYIIILFAFFYSKLRSRK